MINAICEALTRHGREELRKHYHVDCCIDAAAIIIDVLDHFHIPARPLYSKVHVLNSAAIEYITRNGRWPSEDDLAAWEDARCKWLTVGEGSRPNGYSGHVVVVAEESVLIDLTLNQADRPEYAVAIPVIIAKYEIEADDTLAIKPNDCLVEYRFDQTRDDFKSSIGWRATKRRKPTVRALIRHINAIQRGNQ